MSTKKEPTTFLEVFLNRHANKMTPYQFALENKTNPSTLSQLNKRILPSYTVKNLLLLSSGTDLSVGEVVTKLLELEQEIANQKTDEISSEIESQKDEEQYELE
jgi:hypothetical protein